MSQQGQELLESVECPVCGTDRFTVIEPACYPGGIDAAGFAEVYSASGDDVLMDQLVACDECTVIYLNPRVRGDLIIQGYRDAVDPRFIEQNAYRVRTFRRQLERLIGRHGITPSADTRVLDVGCAGAAFPKAAADMGFSVVGVEPCEWLARHGREAYGLDIRAGVLAEQDFEPASFDLVSMWDVVEHLTDPQAVLRDIRQILAVDGLLVINYPDYGGLVRRIMGKRWPFLLSVHLTYFTPKTMTRFLNDQGFDVLEINPFWQTLPLAYVLERAAPYFGVFGVLQKVVTKVGLARLGLTYNLSQSLCVARKSPDWNSGS